MIKENWTSKEYQEYAKTGKLPDGSKSKKKNKFGAVKKTYKGRVYHSTAEADWAALLDLRIKAGEIKKWKPQFRIELKSNNIHVCYYYIDFKVWMSDDSIEFHEVKGKKLQEWKTKWKWMKTILKDLEPNSIMVLIQKIKGQFKETERFKDFS